MGETIDGSQTQRPVTRVSHPYHAVNRSHSSAHTPQRQTSHRAEPPPASSHCLPPWHTHMLGSRPHLHAPVPEGRGVELEGPLIVRCPLTHEPF